MMKLSNLLFEEEQQNGYDQSLVGKLIGQGSSRMVYEYSNDKVIKFSEYYDQNKQEIKVYKCLTKKYATQIFDYDKSPKLKWIIAEKAIVDAIEVKDKLIDLLELYEQEYVEMSIPDFFDTLAHSLTLIITSRINTDKRRDIVKTIEYIQFSSWGKEFVSRLENCKVYPIDFNEFNWGIRESTGEVVLVDYGFEYFPPKY